MKKLLNKPRSKDDPNRSALFGSRGSSAQSSPAADEGLQRNPYVRQDSYDNQHDNHYAQGQDPYALHPYDSPTDQSTPSPPGQHRRSAPSRGYSDESQNSARNALFGNRPLPSERDPHTSRAYDSREPDRYEEYQKQAEEDDEDVEGIKQEIRFVKQDSLASTQNAIRIGLEAEEQGRNSLARLGTHSEKLSAVETSLDISAAHAHIADEKAKELKKLNRSMFAVHVNNPFTAKSRGEQEERRIMLRHELEREEREKNRREAYESAQRVNTALKEGVPRTTGNKSRSTITARSAYSFEEDEEDIQIEKDIDANLNTLGDITSRLKGLALATQAEIGAQNEKLDSIANKVCFFLTLKLLWLTCQGYNLDNSIHLNTKRLEKIHK